MNSPKYLIVHHFGGIDSDPRFDTSNQTFEVVDSWHRSLWGFRSSLGHYCGYHYVIDKTGRVTQGRADTDEGAHCVGKNRESVGIALAGNFDTTLPSQAQTEALRALLIQKSEQLAIPLSNIVPHRIFAPYKSCYGRNLSNDWARNLVVPYYTEKESLRTQIEVFKSKVLDLYRRSTSNLVVFGSLTKNDNREA